LQVIINNAAQTVRKPPVFYQHLIEDEVKPPPATVTDTIHVVNIKRIESSGEYRYIERNSEIHEPNAVVLASLPTEGIETANSSALLSQIPLIKGDESKDPKVFPPGLYDRDDQQIDLRRENSWVQGIGEVTTLEMVECHTINAFAPWILISELKPLMEHTKSLSDNEQDGYIVNVSAMEGQFYRAKTTYHPHTNMAKASLNMMTRTSAAQFAALGIYMTAVDTGLITNEYPRHMWTEETIPPLDEWDAATRVLDPVLCGMNGETKLWGCFLKNYKPTTW
jgi:hypothetical protein